MFVWKNKAPAMIQDDDLRTVVQSRNRQSNQDTWEINITLVLVGLMIAGAVIFQAELHDFLMSLFTGAK